MGYIAKTISGLIYKTDFDTAQLDNIWITSPSSGYISLSDELGFVTVRDVSGCVRLLMDPVYESYVVYTKINYTPVINPGNNYINLPSGRRIYNEQPIGTYDGVNRTFTLSEFPLLHSEIVMIDGMPYVRGEDADYTIVGDVITFNYYAPTSPISVAISYDVANNVPYNDSSAGITYYKDIFNNLEVQNFNDPTTNINYAYMKIYNDGTKINVFGSVDGISWIYIGNEDVEPNVLTGLYVRGTETLKVDYFKVIKSDKVVMGKLPIGFTLKTYKEDGTLMFTNLVTDAFITVLTVNEGFSGYFEVYDTTNALIDTSDVFEICGGDEYEFNTTFEIHMMDDLTGIYSKIEFCTEINLGFFTDTTQERKLKLINTGALTLNINIAIVANALIKKGYDFGELAIDTGSGLTVYDKYVQFLNVLPTQEKLFQLRVNRDLNPTMSFQFQDYYGFNMIIRTW